MGPISASTSRDIHVQREATSSVEVLAIFTRYAETEGLYDSAGDLDEQAATRLRAAGKELLTREGAGAIKLHELTVKDLILIVQNYPPLHPENDEVLSAIDSRLDSLHFDAYLSTCSAAEILKIQEGFIVQPHAFTKKISTLLGKELQEKSNGSCKLAELDLPKALDAVRYFALKPFQNRELFASFIKNFVKKDEQGAYDFSLWERNQYLSDEVHPLLRFMDVALQYKEGNESLFDALFNEFLVADRMDECWTELNHSDGDVGTIINLLEFCGAKKEQALPLFRFFFSKFMMNHPFRNNNAADDNSPNWTPLHYSRLISLFGEFGLEFRLLLEKCQDLLIRGSGSGGNIGKDIAPLCIASYTLAKHGILKGILLMHIQSYGTKANSPYHFTHIPVAVFAQFIRAYHFCYGSSAQHIRMLTDIIFINNKCVIEKDTLLPFDLFLDLHKNTSRCPDSGHCFEQLFFIYQKAKEEGRLTISAAHYARLFQIAIDLQRPTINENKKLLETLATELQQRSHNFSTTLSSYHLEQLSHIISFFENETFEPIFLVIEKRVLQRKATFLKLPINLAAPFIIAFGKRSRTNKDLFALFEKYIIDGGQANVNEIVPGYFPKIIHSFLKTGVGSRKLFQFFNETLLRTNRAGGTKAILAELPFPELCTLTVAMTEKNRGTQEFYAATRQELLAREQTLKLEDLTHLYAYGDCFPVGLADTWNCIRRLATRDQCAWLKTLSVEAMTKMIRFVLVGDASFRKPIQQFLLEKVEEKSRLQTLSWKEFELLACHFHKDASDKTILEAIVREILTAKEKLGEIEDVQFFELYIYFKKAQVASQPFISLLEDEFVKTRADGRRVLQQAHANHLAFLLKEYVHQSANPVLYEEIKKELYTRGLEGFKSCCGHHLPTHALEMVNRGLDLQQAAMVDGSTALHYAAGYCHTDLVETLLVKGSLINKENKSKNTALNVACLNGQKESAQKLLQHGANIESSTCESSFKNAFGGALLWKSNPKKIKEFFLYFFGAFDAVRERLESHANEGFIDHFVKNPHLLIEKALHTETQPKNPLEVAFLFQNVALARAVIERLLPSETLLFLDDLTRKYPRHSQKLILYALFAHYCDKGMIKEALLFIEKPGCDLNMVLQSNYSFLLRAIRQGHLAVVQKLIEKKVDLNRWYLNGGTALHIACQFQFLNIAQALLQAGCNPIPLDKRGRTPFALMKKEIVAEAYKDPLERAFLLQDFTLAQETIAAMPEKDFKASVQALKAKYPQSSMEFIEYAAFKIDPKHFAEKVRSAPPQKPEGAHLSDLLPFFDAINFTKPEDPHYIDPALFEFETGTRLVRDLRELLQEEFIDKIANKVVYTGTPAANTDALQTFYDHIERAVLHTIVRLKASQDPAQREKTIIEYLRAARFCGGRIARVAFERYDAVVNGKEATFEKVVYELLGDYRKLLLDSLVPQNDQSVHIANEYFFLLAQDLNLPNKETALKDACAPKVEKEVVRKQFDDLYRPLAIISDCLSMYLQDDNDFRNKCLDWFKKNVPAEYDTLRLDPIRKEVRRLEEAKADRRDIVRYLESQGIAVREMSYEEAIRADQQHVYLEQEVVVDMAARPMQIKRNALAFALQKLGILQRLKGTG